jgi:hypothetical protein
MTTTWGSWLARGMAALALVGGGGACGDDGVTAPSSSPATTDPRGTRDGVEIVPESADDSESGTGAGVASPPQRAGSDSATPVTTPPEAFIDVSTAPGSGDFVGALEDVRGLACRGENGVWTAAGTVVGVEQEWSVDIEWPTGELRCVLRVERVAR